MKKKTIALIMGLTLFLSFELTDVMVGHVTNARQDGHVDWSTHTISEPFTYINYKGLDCYEGDRILTLELYSPANLEDGIVFRKDVVLK